MPEKAPCDLIGRCLHVKDYANTLTFSRVAVLKLQHDGTGEIPVSQVGTLVIVLNVDHAAQILNQVSVRVLRRGLIEEGPAIGICIQHDLQRVNDRGLSAS